MGLRFLFILVAVMMALVLELPPKVFADGPSPGDPGTPQEDKPDTTINVTSGPNGVIIRIGVSRSSPGSSTGATQARVVEQRSGPVCSAFIMNIGNASRGWFEEAAPLHPAQAPWMVTCDNGFSSVVWLPTTTAAPQIDVVVGGGAIAPVDFAAEVNDYLPVPPITIAANPGRGLVALESWFWIEGYNGAPLRRAVTLGLTVLEVEITPQSYEWKFGDGGGLRTISLGQRYPAASDIRHTYQQSSLGAGGAFRVTVDVTFSVRYRVNGGPWEDAAPIIQSFQADYPVQQLQSVLTGGN